MDEIKSIAEEYGRLAWDLLNEPAVLIQLVFIAAMLVPALFLARYIEPKLEGRAREIKGQPGLLRVIVAFLRRLQWLFFVTLLGIAYLATSVAAWPASNYLIYSAMLLSGAWLLITLVSHVIRRRIIGRAFAIATWIYVAMVILGITDDAAAILDRAAFDIGTFRISILGVIEATVFLGVLLLISLNVGNFLDRRIQRIDELTPSLRVLIGKILRIVIILLAFLVAMSGLGIDLTALTVLSGAVGVGIGFGLQKVVSNFISGIIILMDESLDQGTACPFRIGRHARRTGVFDSERRLHHSRGHQLVVFRQLREARCAVRRVL
jgi:small-conductance mechanosensitive channel